MNKEELLRVDQVTAERDQARRLLDEAMELFRIQAQSPIPDYGLVNELFEMCEQHGYGNVMSTVSVLYRQRDSAGAFTVGHCVGTLASFRKKVMDSIGGAKS